MSKSILVETDAPDRASFRLFLSANVVVPIEATPQLAFRLMGIEGDRLMSRLLLHRRDGEPLELFDLRVEGVKGVEVRKTTVTEPGREHETDVVQGDVWVEAYVPGDRPDAFLISGSGVVRARTNHPRTQVLEIPLAVRTRRLVEYRPRNLYLQRGDLAGLPAHVVVTHSRGEPLLIERIEVEPKDLLVATVTPGGRPSALRVAIAFAKDAIAETAPTRWGGFVRVHLEPGPDAAAMPPLEIPVTILPAQPPQKENEPPPEGGGSQP